jgi:hypothetical protein
VTLLEFVGRYPYLFGVTICCLLLGVPILVCALVVRAARQQLTISVSDDAGTDESGRYIPGHVAQEPSAGTLVDRAVSAFEKKKGGKPS